MLEKIIGSAIVIILALVAKGVINFFIRKTAQKVKYPTKPARLVNRIINVTLIILVLIALIVVWGINFENIWLFLTSFLALVAIGFFAVWSVLSSILAGVLFFFTKSIRIGDEITIIPEKISGKVIKIGVVFLLLKDKKGNYVRLPNNMVFQRIVLTKKRA